MIAAASSGAAAARAATRLSREQAPSTSGEMGRQQIRAGSIRSGVSFCSVMISRYLKEEKKFIENPFFFDNLYSYSYVLNS